VDDFSAWETPSSFIPNTVHENGSTPLRELQGLGFTGGIVQVQRWQRLQREQRKWSELATMRFETGPGEQAPVDYGQLKIWIGEQVERVYLLVFTLGYSRRLYAHAYRHERLTSLLDGHVRAFRWFGGVTLSCLYDNPRDFGLGPRRAQSPVASVNAELPCHLIADYRCPSFNELFVFRARGDRCRVRTYAAPPSDDLVESRAGAAVLSGACWLSMPARRFSLSRKLSPLMLIVLEWWSRRSRMAVAST
jgi:hypothetical protein